MKQQNDSKNREKASEGRIVQNRAGCVNTDSYDYLGKSCSASDCTGLIPSEPQSKAEQDSYEDLYHYQPRPISKNSSKS